MSLAKLRAAKGIHDFAPLVGFTPSNLAYVLYKLPSASKYSTFDVPKKAGGIRTISAPIPQLKQLQTSLSVLLQDCIAEAEKTRGVRGTIAHGFKRGFSNFTNASVHRARRFVFNIDIEDFFGQLNFGRVRGFFISSNDFLLDPAIATLIAQIACHDNKLPQGSPCSPVISNLIGHILDIKLIALAKRARCSYTRYADDLTFSTNALDFPKELASTSPTHLWTPSTALGGAIGRAGFSINPAKTRMLYRDSRQSVTGLITNRRVNTSSDYRRASRSMAHRLFTTGEFHLDTAGASVGTIAQLIGRLSYAEYIDRRVEAVDAKSPLARTELLGDVLFYRDFFAMQRPVVLGEGKTDRVHLRCAVERLLGTYPQLAVASAPGIQWNARFFKVTRASSNFHGLDGGTSSLANFIRSYGERLSKFRNGKAKEATVVVVDQDSGLKPVRDALKRYKLVLDPTKDFQRVVHNLYVVCLPNTGDCIEDLYDPNLLKTTLSGKTFNKSNKALSDNEYGKAYFAEHVVIPGKATIDFSGFAGILRRICLAIENYRTLP